MTHQTKRLLVVIIALGLGVAALSYFNVGPNPNGIGRTGLSFQACTDYSDGSPDCTNSMNIPLSSVGIKNPIDVRFQGASGSFTYQGTPRTWSFACAGTINFGKGQSTPITASASGSGSPPSNWPITMTPKQWNLSSIYGVNYGQKNLTAQLGSKASPCSLTVLFNELNAPMRVSYRYASLAKWSVNYQASSVTTTTLTSSSSSQTTTTSTTSSITTSSQTTTSTSTTQTSTSTSSPTTTSTSSTTTGSNTITTSQTDIWKTTVTSATGGLTGNTASNGVIVTLAPDINFPTAQSIVWVFIPPTFPCQGNLQYNCEIFINLVTPSVSISSTGGIGVIGTSGVWTQASFQVGLDSSTPYMVVIYFSNSNNWNNPAQIFNEVVPQSQPIQSGIVPAPFTTQYQSWLQTIPQTNRVVTTTISSTISTTISNTPTTVISSTITTTSLDVCAYYAQVYPNSNPPAGCPGHVGPADRLSIISLTF